MIDDEDTLIAEFLADGVLDIAVSKDGDISYKLGPMADILQPEFAADMRKVVDDELDEALLGLFEKGLMTIEYDENLIPHFSIPAVVKDMLDEMENNW